MLSDTYQRVPLISITIDREKRQRRAIDTTGLIDSIGRHGVMNPIIVTPDPINTGIFLLVAGERRYESSRALGLLDIPCRLTSDLSPIEHQLLELEENLKRADLNWQDQCNAARRIHDLQTLLNGETWDQKRTAISLGLSEPWVSQALRVAEEIHKPEVARAQTLTAAYNALIRKDDRKIADAMSDVISTATTLFAPTAPQTLSGIEELPVGTQPGPYDSAGSTIIPLIRKSQTESIYKESFLNWAPTYSGPPFNLIHCDFPYGINVFTGEKSGRDRWTNYVDTPDTYWTLIKCLCANMDKIMSQSAHLMFWFSMEYYHETLEAFRALAPSLYINPMPLIWVKSDNVGMLPDPRHGPRQIYETCFLGIREGRQIVRAVGNAYASPTDKAHHPSTKPEPMLRHFMSMLVDDNTRMLDPTCGSGSALRAAESLGANTVLGLEMEQEYYDASRTALRHFRVLREATK